jgi:hypothetical protein
MRNRSFLAALLIFTPLLFAHDDPTQEYGKILARVQAGDQKVDFRRLRMTYMDSWQRHQKVDTTAAKKQMMTDLFAKNFDAAIRNANAVLDHDFVDIQAQYTAYLAHRELKHHQQAEFHEFVMKGLLKSIVASGKGSSKDSPFIVIAPDEEQMLLLFLGLQAINQNVEIGDGHTFDVVQVKDQETGKNVTVYFNLDIPAKYAPQSIPKPAVASATQGTPASEAAPTVDATASTAGAESAPPVAPNAEAPAASPQSVPPASPPAP